MYYVLQNHKMKSKNKTKKKHCEELTTHGTGFVIIIMNQTNLHILLMFIYHIQHTNHIQIASLYEFSPALQNIKYINNQQNKKIQMKIYE